MAVLLTGTTIGGHSAIHAGNLAAHGIITTSNISSSALSLSGGTVTGSIVNTGSATSFRNRIGIGDGNGTPYTNTGSPGIWLSYNGASTQFMGAESTTSWGVYINSNWRMTVSSGGVVTATTFSGSLSGNATTATTLQTARTIGGVSFNGSANINLPGVNTAGNQNTTGNAASATILQTTRTINGTNFNGSGNITTSTWGTARTLTIGNTAKSVNGGGNVSWTLAEIGAQAAGSYAAASHTHDDRYYTETESDAKYWKGIAGSVSATTSNPFDSALTQTRVTGNGNYVINYTGASAQLISSATGGSASIFHIGAHYNGSDFYMRTRTDSATWQTWKRLWHSGDFTSTNISNWNTAYADRNKWDGGSTGLNAATGRTSLGLGSAATANTGDFLGASATAVDSSKLGGVAAASYARLASPALSGTPTAPTAATATNTTQIATTAFVKAQGYLTSLPSHTHSDATTSVAGFMSSTDKTKLNGIAAGAEVNVQSDWNATSGDALILNKPTIPTNNNQLTNGAGYVTSSGVTSVTVGTGLDVTTGATPNITLDLSEFTDMTAAMVGSDEFIVLDAGEERRKAANEINLSIFNNDLSYLPDVTPVAPVVSATNIVGETIEVVFGESPTPGIDYYQVWSSVDGGSYGLIAQIPDTDFAPVMTVIDASFSVSGTIAYRVYAVKSGVYSSPGTASKVFTASDLDVLNMSVISLNTAYYIQYDLPDSRFVDHIEIYMDAETTDTSLSRTGATLIYSGENTNYMYQISSADFNKYHQFWVEVIES